MLISFEFMTRGLEDLWGKINHTQDNIGFLEWVYSLQNIQAGGWRFSQLMGDTSQGKIHKVKVGYTQRRLISQTVANATLDCTPGTAQQEFQTEYDIDPDVGRSDKGTITSAELIRNELYPNGKLFEDVSVSMDVLKRGINEDWMAQVGANLGNFAGTGSPLPVIHRTLKADNETFGNPPAVAINRAYRQMNAKTDVNIFGQGQIADYFDFIPFGNQDSGDNQAELLNRHRGLKFHYDEYVEDSLGADQYFCTLDGIIQAINWNQFRGPGNTKEGEMEVKMMLPDRTIPNLMWDFRMYDFCGTTNWQLKLTNKLVFLPTNLAQAADKLDGVTWTNTFKVVN